MRFHNCSTCLKNTKEGCGLNSTKWREPTLEEVDVRIEQVVALSDGNY